MLRLSGFLSLCLCTVGLLPTAEGWSFFTPGAATTRKTCAPTSLSMKIKVGLVGLPNVGKSTLFNAIAQKSIAEAQNFPFCTIEPNSCYVPIPDAGNHLRALAKLAGSKKALPATISLIDVAGLVKGASRGEGLGNKFLATIREVDLVVHVVRNYVDDDVVHVEGKVDPVADAEVVNLELLLADLAHVQRRLDRNTCAGEERDVLSKVERALEEGSPARSIGLTAEERFAIKSMGLLSLKPVLYAFNVDEVDFTSNRAATMREARGYLQELQYCDLDTDACTVVSAKLESELASLSAGERGEYLESMGVAGPPSAAGEAAEAYAEHLSYRSLPLLVKDALGLGLLYTGPGVPAERSQTTKTHILTSSGSVSAVDFAGKLHGDIKTGFMHADIISAQDLIRYDSYAAAKEKGRIRMEGKDYTLQADDVVLIKWK